MTTNTITAEDRLAKLGIHLSRMRPRPLVRTCMPFRRVITHI